MGKIAVLIPCYNEELTVEKVVKDFRKELPEADIYVYDNNSTDKTYELAKKAGAIVRKENRQGKANVIRTMFREIDADIYVMVDGDDTYPAEEVHKLIEPIENNEADMVTGDRISNGTYLKEMKKSSHKFGNKLVRGAINILFNSNLKDIMSGYRAFSKLFVKNLPIMTSNFELETEMTIFALDKKFRIKEIPINFRERPKNSKSKINTIPDGIKVISTITRMFRDYKPLKFFTILFFIFIILGLIVGVPVIVEFYKTRYITKVPSAILASGLVILAFVLEQCGILLNYVYKEHREDYELNLLRNDKK